MQALLLGALLALGQPPSVPRDCPPTVPGPPHVPRAASLPVGGLPVLIPKETPPAAECET